MTKKHFELIAKVIAEYSFTDEQDRVNLASRMATVLHSTNPNFNTGRFVTACGVER